MSGLQEPERPDGSRRLATAPPPPLPERLLAVGVPLAHEAIRLSALLAVVLFAVFMCVVHGQPAWLLGLAPWAMGFHASRRSPRALSSSSPESPAPGLPPRT